MRAGTSAGAVGIARYLRASVRLKYPSDCPARCHHVLGTAGAVRGAAVSVPDLSHGLSRRQAGATTWDERLTGERIERARAACKSTPAASVLRVFTEAWSR